MSHDNLGFTEPAQCNGHTDMSEIRRKLYEEGNRIGDPFFNTDILSYCKPRDLLPRPIQNGKAHGCAINGVFVIDNQGKKMSTEQQAVVENGDLPEDIVGSEDYSPHDERDVPHPTTNCETLLHLLKGSLGTGILAMPNAFFNSGYAVGTLATVIIGIICTYCIHILVNTGYELCKLRRVPSLSFPNTTVEALLEGPAALRKCASISAHIVNVFLLIYQLGMCCVYVVFISSNLKQVVDQYYGGLHVRYYMLMILLPLILMNWVRNLKLLAPFMSAANALTFVGFGMTFYYVFNVVPDIGSRKAVGELKDFPLFFGTVLFALEAIGVILPLENNMETPRAFGGTFGVMNRAMTIIITLYVMFGFFGYIRYGDKVLGSITLNLPEGETLAQCVKIILSLAIFATHALQCYVAIDIAWNHYLLPRFEKSDHKLFYELLLRTVLVVFTFSLAVAIPNLELFIALIGALCISALGIAFPAIIQMSFYWYRVSRGMFWLMIIKNTLIVVFGIVGLVVGTTTSIAEIVATFFEDDTQS